MDNPFSVNAATVNWTNGKACECLIPALIPGMPGWWQQDTEWGPAKEQCSLSRWSTSRSSSQYTQAFALK